MWGLISLEYLQAELPQQSFLYLWDTKYLPYGNKSPEFLQERTFACLEWMFGQWCKLVILACNSASAYAIRSRQETYPDRKVLSVTVPGVEAIVEWDYHQAVLLATQATVESDIYHKVLRRAYPSYTSQLQCRVGTDLVQMIEQWADEQQILQQLAIVMQWCDDADCVILWCTHYPLIATLIQQVIWTDVHIINPARESAHKLWYYLKKHPEMDVHNQISWKSKRRENQYFVTGDMTEYAGIQVTQVVIESPISDS